VDFLGVTETTGSFNTPVTLEKQDIFMTRLGCSCAGRGRWKKR
jgi:hypothetical protein